VELSDGWYALRAVLDPQLAALAGSGRLVVRRARAEPGCRGGWGCGRAGFVRWRCGRGGFQLPLADRKGRATRGSRAHPHSSSCIIMHHSSFIIMHQSASRAALPSHHLLATQPARRPTAQVGCKLRIAGAELLSPAPCEPLDEGAAAAALRLHYNGVSPAAWDARLGALHGPQALPLRPLQLVRPPATPGRSTRLDVRASHACRPGTRTTSSHLFPMSARLGQALTARPLSVLAAGVAPGGPRARHAAAHHGALRRPHVRGRGRAARAPHRARAGGAAAQPRPAARAGAAGRRSGDFASRARVRVLGTLALS
jgi:hypothetical protein